MVSKVLLAYLYNMQKSGKHYWGSDEYLASNLGIEMVDLDKSLSKLEKLSIVRRDSENGLWLNLTLAEIAEFDAIQANTVENSFLKSLRRG
jgi:hypothetical protein